MKYIFVAVVVLALVGCTSAPSGEMVQTAIAQTQAAQPTNTPLLQPQASPTLRPTSTSRPTSTISPTKTPVPPTPTPTMPGQDVLFALNFVAAQESGGIYIEVARVLFGKRDVLRDMGWGFEESDWDGYDVVGEIMFKVANTSDKILIVYPDQAKIIIGDEQLELSDWWIGDLGDTYSGEIYPGVTLIGGSWFGLKRSDVPDITKMIIAIDRPYDKDYNRLGEDYYFEIDLTDHTWEDLPEELD